VKQEINQDRRRLLAVTAATIAALELPMLGSTKSLLHGVGGELSALRGATTWLNSPPLTELGLRGHVVLVNFCTYTCINWLRQLPYVRAWAEKYRDQGLVVIGVHTPEFSFENDLGNVRRAIQTMRVDYPIAVDNEYAIWQGFDNHYWPALYFIDAEGAIRHQQFGEGSYEEAERTIQRLLAKAGTNGLANELVTVGGEGIEAPADWYNLRSPENYLGADRTEGFVRSTALRLNQWTVFGNWTLARHAAVLNEPNGRIVSRFHARDLHLVMGPAARGTSVRCRVRIDGQPPGVAHGNDVDEHGNGAVGEQRLYQLIRQPPPIVDRQFEIEFLDSGVATFAFTFG
jgi:thiol-disulfide isomerase/thioredoxin